jgi:hypothetical protein
MLDGKLKACFFVASLLLATAAASGQEVVHALTGTVASIDATAKTISMYTDNRSAGLFKDLTNAKANIVFDKTLRALVTPADEFKKQGAYGIVFYFGQGDTRTAVALRSFGQGPFTSAEGIVAKSEAGDHSFSVTDDSGAVTTFKIASDTVAETMLGAVAGFKSQPHKGDKVHVTAKTVNGVAMALFINTLVAN